MSDNDYIHIFDTTLRDGEQAPGCSMTSEEKLRVRLPARAPGGGHNRGGVSHILRGGLQVRKENSAEDKGLPDSRPLQGKSQGT